MDEFKGVMLGVIPVFAIGIYSLPRGVFWGGSIDVVLVLLGAGCLICVVGMLYTWRRNRSGLDRR